MPAVSLRSRQGMVLVIVIVAVMLMTTAVVGILSRNISSAFIDEKGRQRFQAELLTKGAFWRAYQNAGALPADFTETIDGTTYTVHYTLGAAAGGPLGTTQVSVQVTY